MPKMKTKSALKGKVSFTATGKLKVARGNKNHFKDKKSKRANLAGRQAQYLKDCHVKGIKKIAPYGI